MGRLYVFYQLIFLGWILLGSSACARKVIESSKGTGQILNRDIVSWSQPVLIHDKLIIDQEVVIYPGTYVETTSTGKVIFSKPVSIIGQHQVFDEKVNIEFKDGALSVINPVWFGARGYDTQDDTKAFKKTFELVSQLSNPVRIEIPIGKFILSEQIIVDQSLDRRIPIHIQGISNSYNGVSGSSLVWAGGEGNSIFLLKNLSNTLIENLDFGAEVGHYVKHNLELRPFVNQLAIVKCSFSGCAGEGSSNINLNEGNNLQVSEIIFENCTFRGAKGKEKNTYHAVTGGWANTKNFYFSHCSFGPYAHEAIRITTTDILVVEGCTFFENDVDISCETCKSLLQSDYSENSNAFFKGTASANFNATTLINNQFIGNPTEGFVIRDGSGTLILLNNNFGAGNYLPDLNRIRWEETEFNTIYSVGNVYKNSTNDQPPFYNRYNKPFNKEYFESIGDLGGVLGEGKKRLKNNTANK